MTEKFKAKIACWTNFTPDHIDWHGGLENYFNAKAKIFLPPQEPEFAILNAQDTKLKEFSKQCKNVVFLIRSCLTPHPSPLLKEREEKRTPHSCIAPKDREQRLVAA